MAVPKASTVAIVQVLWSPLPDPKVYCYIAYIIQVLKMDSGYLPRWLQVLCTSTKWLPRQSQGALMTLHMSEGVWGFWWGRLKVNAILGGPGSCLCSARQRVLGVNSVHLSSWGDVKGLPKRRGTRISGSGEARPLCQGRLPHLYPSVVPRSRVASKTLDLGRPGSCRNDLGKNRMPEATGTCIT